MSVTPPRAHPFVSPPIPFSSEELTALRETRSFDLKRAATSHLMESFEELRAALRPGVGSREWCAKATVDAAKGTLTRGEDYLGLPYVVLDFPKLFTKHEFLTMRTMFWWGHYVAYALILRGAWLAEAVDRLDGALPAFVRADVEATLAPDPWDWRRGAGHTRPLRDDADTRHWLREREFLKLLRFLPVEGETFTSERIIATGVATWELYAPLTSPG